MVASLVNPEPSREVNGESFCEQSDKDFVFPINVSCNPDEKSLKNCGSSNKISCSAEMTAMAVCEGDGDNSRNSQKKATPKNLCWVSCHWLTLLHELQHADRPVPLSRRPRLHLHRQMSQRLQRHDSLIHGNGIYDDISNICKAGIHAGIIDNRRGFVTVKIGFAHKAFKEAVCPDLGSVKIGWSKKYFTLSKTLDWHKKLSVENYAHPFVGLIAPF